MTKSTGGSRNDLFNIAIATIFAREFLEGSIIVVNYRSIILKKEEWDETRKKEALRAVTIATILATFVAGIVVISIAVPLGILGNDLNERDVEIVEGVSKLVATLFILHFSLKIPVWLGVYDKVPLCGLKKFIKVRCCGKTESAVNKEAELDQLNSLTLGEIRFNVMWNLWREVCECGIFLIPFFLESGSRAIPISGLTGIATAIVLAVLIYQANQRLTNKGWLAVFMAGLTLMLSVGLLVGAVSEFQEVVGSSGGEEGSGDEGAEEEHEEEHEEEEEEHGSGDEGNLVYSVKNEFWADDRFPMVLLKPFGYSSTRTALQIAFFWLYLAFGLSLHWIMYHRSQQARAIRRQAEEEKGTGHQLSKAVDEEAAQDMASDDDDDGDGDGDDDDEGKDTRKKSGEEAPRA